jgi:hypothetical protein
MNSEQEIDANAFAGAWRLAEAYAETPDGRRPFPLGDGTRGLIMYDTEGHMSAQLMSANRKPFSARNLEDVPLEEFKTTYLGYTSYFGTYTLDVAKKTITHHVEGALTAGWVGGDQLRYFEFADGALVLKTPPMRTADGTKVVNTLVWRRAC